MNCPIALCLFALTPGLAAASPTSTPLTVTLAMMRSVEVPVWLLGISGIVALFFGYRCWLAAQDRADSEQRTREEIWRCLYEHSVDGIVLSKPDGSYIAANRAACEMLDMTEEEVLARGRSLIVNSDTGDFASLLAQRERHGTVRCLLQLRRKDGTVIDAEGSSSTFQSGRNETRIVTLFRDITERGRADASARENALRWQAALEAAGDGLWDWEVESGKVHFSPGWKEMLGFTPDELSDSLEEWETRVHPDDLPVVLRVLKTHLAGETESYRCEHRVRCKDGTYKWILDAGRVVSRTADGKARRMIGTHKDLSGLRLAEQKLGESEERYRLLFDNASDALIAFPIESDGQPGKIIEANEAAWKMAGCTRAELLAMGPLELETPAGRAGLPARMAALQRTGRALFETEIRVRAGAVIPLEVHSQFFRRQDQWWVLSSMRDISGRREAAAEIARLARERQTILETLPVGVGLVVQRRFRWTNSAFAQITGRGPAALIGADSADLYADPESYRRLGEEGYAAIARGETYEAEVEFFRGDGSRFWGQVTGRAFNPTHLDEGVLWVLSDVTARRTMAETLHRSEDQLASILASTSDGILAVDSEGRVLRASARFAAMWRIPPALIASGNDQALLACVVDQLSEPEEFLRIVRELYGTDRESSDVVHFKDGRCFERTSSPLRMAGKVVGRFWSFRDATARMQAEQALRATKAQLAATIEALSDLFFILDTDGRIVDYHQPVGAKLLVPPAVFLGKTFAEVLPPHVSDQITESLRALAITGDVQHFDYELSIEGKKMWWTASISRRTDHTGGKIGTVVLVRDMTDRKRAEQALRESEEKFHQTFYHAPLVMVVTNLADGRILAANAMAQRLSGIESSAGLGRTVVELGWFTEDERTKLVHLLRTEGHVTDLEMNGRRKDGEIIACLVNCQLVTFQGEQHVIATLQDISARKRAETKLRESEENYLGLFNTVSEAIYVHDVNGVFLDVNEGAARLYGRTREELIGLTPAAVSAPGRNDLEAVGRSCAAVFATGQPVAFEFWGVRKNGEVFPKACVTHRGTYFGRDVLITTARDITPQRHAEAALMRSELRFRTLFQYSPFGAMEEDFSDIKVRFDELRAAGVTDFASHFADHPEEVATLAGRLKIITVNEGAARLFGLPSTDPERFQMAKYLSPDAHGVFARELAALAEGSTLYNSEITSLDAAGNHVELDLTLTVQPGHEAKLDRVIVSFIDITQRKRAEASLRESEERYRTLVELSPEAVFVHDQGRIQFANRAAVRLAGADSAKELVGLRLLDFVHADSRDLVERRLRTLTTEGELNPLIRQKWHRRDGSVIEAAVVATRVTFDGAPATLAIATDITAQLQAEAELRKLSRAVEQCPVSVIITDATGAFEYVNPSFTATTGYTFEDVRGRNVRLLASGLQSSEHDDQLWSRISAGHEWRGEFHNRKKNGDVFWEHATISPLTDDAGRVTHYLGVLEDVTERKAAEARIREQAALLDITQDAILVLDLDRTICYWNRGAERLYGVSAADAVGRRYESIAYQELPADYDAEWNKFLARGECIVERRQMARVRGEITVQKRGTLVRDEEQRPKSVLIVITDITDAKRLETQYLRAQRLESLGSLAGGVAHDLNNVLTPILMSSSLLARSAHTAHERELVELLTSSARRGADIVQQLLLYGRGSDSPRSPMSVGRVIKDMVRIMNETFPKNITVDVDVPSDLWMIDGDRTQIHQVLLNLCVNSRDAMPAGGSLLITAENLRVDDAFACTQNGAKPGPHVMFRVTDTGTGIAPAHQEKIFDPFFTTKPIGQGTGLGLASALGIIRSHGGFITVASKEGLGTNFAVYLPARAAAVEPIDTGPTLPSLRGRNELVLVIDDEASIRGSLNAALRIYGYRVLVASDGAAGLALFRARKDEIGIVVTDMMMPVMDGARVIREVRESRPVLPIIAMSGIATNRAELESTPGGRIRFLAKPFVVDQVLTLLRELLDSAPAPGGTAIG